ncbi:bifunctional 2-polyprenyl-6-hydroxyphenol methylase/3-demethylubiquinol 3-O-methyltransferase UbiG [Henriciella sp.]|uniref:bifunctional 2-polyprenyl-6-hydroxyphenol methylase/3-demethylubiquinol 3-O-methyltransferase UbiG n=1 Tax=Henriciella sp. TaxID=1968823 RepID=UPI002623BD8E|nr:bifunctional 2-polyprenyl-6-hydroxyphenol methylase/3-demethylubiquinol 3-O-methyltransferase UbiG [Henriciella sp.]
MDKIAENRQDLPRTPSIDADEVAKFSAMAAEWWDPKGKFKPLHRFNPVRLGFIRDTITAHFGRMDAGRKPLEGLRILDIGCGGGLVSEPMARLGADVTGVDASADNIKTAMTHAEESGLNIDYRAGTAEGLLEDGTPAFDVVLNLEVVEHVADPQQFLQDTAALVKPGGLMIAATLNRTPKAFALAIVGAEYVLGWLPRGTHEFSKFLTPDEVARPLETAGLVTRPSQGVSFNPLTDTWRLSSDDKVNYMIVADRPDGAN